jgi:hypothetical protein
MTVQESIANMEYMTTETLKTMALNWPVSGGLNEHGLHFCWQYTSSDQQDAYDFYSLIEAEEGEDSVRYYASDALAAAGWTRTSINYRNS